MKLGLYEKIKITRGLYIFNQVEKEYTFENVEEFEKNHFSYTFNNINYFDNNINKLLKNLLTEFATKNKIYIGFVVINKNNILNSLEYIWKNFKVTKVFVKYFPEFQLNEEISKIIKKEKFINKMIEIIYDNDADISSANPFYINELDDFIIKYESNLYALRDYLRKSNKICFSKKRYKKKLKIYDYIFSTHFFGRYRGKPSLNQVIRNNYKYIALTDGKITPLTDEIVKDFSENGFIRSIDFNKNKLSLLTNTKYIIKSRKSKINKDFKENVYFVLKDPDIILYDKLKVINSNDKLLSHINDNIYHPKYKSNGIPKNYKFLTFGVINDFFNFV